MVYMFLKWWYFKDLVVSFDMWFVVCVMIYVLFVDYLYCGFSKNKYGRMVSGVRLFDVLYVRGEKSRWENILLWNI